MPWAWSCLDPMLYPAPTPRLGSQGAVPAPGLGSLKASFPIIKVFSAVSQYTCSQCSFVSSYTPKVRFRG